MSVTQASNVVKCRNGWGTSYFNQLFGWLDGFNSTHCSAFYRALTAQHWTKYLPHSNLHSTLLGTLLINLLCSAPT